MKTIPTLKCNAALDFEIKAKINLSKKESIDFTKQIAIAKKIIDKSNCQK